jgi:hypothetical protein
MDAFLQPAESASLSLRGLKQPQGASARASSATSETEACIAADYSAEAARSSYSANRVYASREQPLSTEEKIKVSPLIAFAESRSTLWQGAPAATRLLANSKFSPLPASKRIKAVKACSSLPSSSLYTVCFMHTYRTPPNPSLKLTRYGTRRKPGVCQFKHRHTPGLRRMPPRAA